MNKIHILIKFIDIIYIFYYKNENKLNLIYLNIFK